MLAIDREIGIERQHGVPFVDFPHSHYAAAWWNNIAIDPTAAARVLWLKTHPLPTIVGQPGTKLQNEPKLETTPP
jgi:hypothetical protein